MCYAQTGRDGCTRRPRAGAAPARARKGAGATFRLLQLLGFAAWFGAGLWFGAFGAQALFRRLGAAGAAAPLGALFPSLFTFGLVAGLAALAGSLGWPAGAHGGLRSAAAALVVVCAAADLVVDRLLHAATPGTAAFARGHGASVALALLGWLAALTGLLAQ